MLSIATRPASVERLVALLIAASVLATTLLVGVQSTAEAKSGPPVTIQFLNVSDWHGQLDPLDLGGGNRRGGASVISTYWQADRAANPNTIALTGGDDFGASPPLSNFFDEEPAVLAQRMMGIQFGTFGNHNFDRGLEHLQRMIDLARLSSEEAPGNPLQYVSANLDNVKGALRHAKPFEIVKVGGVKVAIIGITNPEAPELVFPGSFGPIVITDSAAAANAARAEARRAGALVVVAIIHAGVRGVDAGTGAPFGELIDFANDVEGFDVIFGDHTDIQFSGVVNDQLVVENRSKGLTYARTQVTVDPVSGAILARSSAFVSPICSAANAAGACTATPLGAPDPALEAMLAPYRAELNPILGVVIGESNIEVPRSDKCGGDTGRLCESRVGNAVTDAMREIYGTDIALTNSGGLRAPLTCPPAGGGSGVCPAFTPPPYLITRGQALTLLPFGNQTVTLQLNGAEVKAMLENGVRLTGAQGRFPQVSGLCFTYDVHRTAGDRVTSAVWQADDGSCTGPAFDFSATASYTLATNDFVASGGDGYPNFAARMVTRNLMVNDVVDWVTANTPINPVIQGRITCTTSGATACPVVTAP